MSYNNNKKLTKATQRKVQVMHNIYKTVIARHWTYDALECYSRHCNCIDCNIQALITTRCVLNFTVNKLLEKFGKPTEKICKELGFNYERLKTWE